MPRRGRRASTQIPSTELDAEKELWELIKGSKDPNDFNEYLTTYENGLYSAQARILLRRLDEQAPNHVAPPKSVDERATRQGEERSVKELEGDCFTNENPFACISLGNTLATNGLTDQTAASIVAPFKKACKLDEEVGCGPYVGILEEVCGMDSANAFNRLAYYRWHGIGTKLNRKGANELFRKSCTLKNGKGCASLGKSYADGIGVSQNYGLANHFYQKSCKLFYGFGCCKLARNIAAGRGANKDVERAKKILKLGRSYGYKGKCDK